MRRTRGEDNKASKDAPSSSATGGYYTAGPPATVLPYDEMNIIQEELAAIAVLKGGSLDTTGVDDNQCADVLEGVVKAIEGRNAEAASVDTLWTFAVIASDDATVGEDGGGVVHAAVIASQNSQAKGFESVAIACTDARAGNAGGTTDSAAVIASEDVVTEGDHSIVVASLATSGTATSTATRGAIIASSFDASNTYLGGQDSAIIASNDSLVDGNRCAVVGGDTNTIDDASGTAVDSFIGGGAANAIAGDGCATVGTHECTIDNVGQDCIVAGGYQNDITNSVHSGIYGGQGHTLDDADSAAIVGGTNNGIDPSADRSIIAGGTANLIDNSCADSLIAASRNSQIDNTVGTALVASRYCQASLGGNEANYMLAGGYDGGTTLVAPSWLIQSNGGAIYATDTSVNAIDYAELFPNADGKAHPAGALLALSGRGCRLAKRGDRVLGPVSATPSIVGGDDRLGWDRAFQRDEFGAFVWGPVEQVDLVGPDKATLAEVKRRKRARAAEEKARADLRKAAGRDFMKAERAARDGQAAVRAADAEAGRLAQELEGREAHAAKRAAQFAEAGKLKRLLRGSHLEALSKRADEQVVIVRQQHESALAAVVRARAAVQEAITEAVKRRAELARLEAPIPEVDLSDLDLSPREVRKTVITRLRNPKWDPARAKDHKPRRNRPDEWTVVGLLGQVRVRVDATVKAGDFVVPGDVPGVGTQSAGPAGRCIECMAVEVPYDEKKGYGVAFCLVG